MSTSSSSTAVGSSQPAISPASPRGRPASRGRGAPVRGGGGAGAAAGATVRGAPPFRGRGIRRGLPPAQRPAFLAGRGASSSASSSSAAPASSAHLPSSSSQSSSSRPARPPSSTSTTSPSSSPTHSPDSRVSATSGLPVDDDDEHDSSASSSYGLLESDLQLLDIDAEEVDDDLTAFQRDALVKQALTQGVDLRLYSQQVEEKLAEAEQGCVSDYLTSAGSLSSLHLQLSSCDGILLSMSSMLSSFQSDLGVISREIQELQEKSRSMSVRLGNRKEAERLLFSFIHAAYIPEQLATAIMEAEINDHYILQLHSLHQRILFAQQHLVAQSAASPSPRHSQAVLDVIPSLLRLKLKAVSRIRTFLLERFHALQKPKTNIQIKQKLLVKYRYLYEFLLYHTDAAFLQSSSCLSSPHVPVLDVDVGAEVRQQYQLTMSHIYSHKFKQYLQSLSALQQQSSVERTDVLGSEESWMRVGVTGLFTSKKTAADIGRAFVLGERFSVLQDSGDDLIIPHVAEREGRRFGFERLFKSSQQLLMDTATSEYDFIVDFFGERMPREGDRAGLTEDEWMRERERSGVVGIVSGPSVGDEERGRENLLPHSRDKHLFHSVFASTIALFIAHVESYLASCHDCLSVLLLIRLLCQHNLQMQYRRVHCLDVVFDRMNMMLWPRFKTLFDAHVLSVMRITHCDIRGVRTANTAAAAGSASSSSAAAAPSSSFSSSSSSASSPPASSSSSSPSTPASAPSAGTVAAYQRPLFVSHRYAQLASAIHRLNRPWNDDILVTQLRRLRTEVEKLIQRSAARISVPKMQIVFLINQYAHITSVMLREGLSADSEDVQAWQELSRQQIGLFAEEELSDKFRQLIAFVRQTETALQAEHKTALAAAAAASAAGASPAPAAASASAVDLTSLEPIVKHFAKYWRQGIEQIASSVRLYFNDSGDDGAAGGSSLILQTLFVQLLLYYQRLSKIVREHARHRPSVIKDLVPSNTISFEIRKYTESKER